MLSEESIKKLAHRRAWRYKMSSDPHHSDTYTFNDATLMVFANDLMAAAQKDVIAAATEKDTTRG